MERGKSSKALPALYWIAGALTANLFFVAKISGQLNDNVIDKSEKGISIASCAAATELSEVFLIDDDFVQYEIPDLDTDFKTYMDYHAITDKNSVQYRMQQDAWTDEYGLRRLNDDYMIALGTYYTKSCGERFKITLASGNTFTAVVGDIKADEHTDINNQFSPVYNAAGEFIGANVVEFIVDTACLPKNIKTWGSVGACPEFKGDITIIERINCNDSNADVGSEV